LNFDNGNNTSSIAGSTEAAVADKLVLRFVTPTKTLMHDKKVDMLTLPGSAGELGVAPNHVPTVVQLTPGVVGVHAADEAPQHYFVSGGFAVVNKDSTASVTVAEAVEIGDLDVDAVHKGLDEFRVKMEDANASEIERAEAQIGHEVHTMMNHALETHGKK
jgi:F-type H+-transporting ATPase subunit delta